MLKIIKGKIGSIFALGALVLLLAAVASFSSQLPQAEAAAGQTSHFRFSGNGAQAGWTTCPEGPSIGVTCTDTYIFAADQLIRADGTKSQSTFLYLDQYSYTLDVDGNWVFVLWRSGFTESAAFSMIKPQKLQSASVSTDVPVVECTPDACVEDEIVHVEASWTGQGNIVRTAGNYRAGSKDFNTTFHSRGTFRDADATGNVDGAGVGSEFFASLFSTRDGSVYVCHSDVC